MASFAWRKPPIGTTIVLKFSELKAGELVMVYDRQPTGGGWWKPGRIEGPEREVPARVTAPNGPTAVLVRYLATRARRSTAAFELHRIRRVPSPALAALLAELLDGGPGTGAGR